ncbi:MAG TPA: DUF6702 family protein [Gemmatimonadaceae bacterium]|nr:DUF6702 family protein [Gemmatimonadaceae bacterium]
MVTVKRLIRTAILAGIVVTGLFVPRGIASAHPLHTSLAEIGYDERSGMLTVSLRVFADDVAKASMEYARRISPKRATMEEPRIAAYALSVFVVADRSGTRLLLSPCGEKHIGEMMWLCFKTRVASHPGSLRVSNSILFEKYPDQINVVQAALKGRKATALFSPGDGFKQLQ